MIQNKIAYKIQKIIFYLSLLFLNAHAAILEAQIEYKDALKDRVFQCGILEAKEYVFFTGCSKNLDDSVKDLKLTTHFDAQNHIKRYYLKDINFDTEIANSYSAELKKYVLEHIAKYGLQFNFKDMQLVEVIRTKYTNEGTYVTVLGISKEELKKFSNNFLPKLKNIDYYLNGILIKLQEEENFSELSDFYLKLGLIDLALSYKQKELSIKYNLVNFFNVKNPYKSREIYKKIVLNKEIKSEYLHDVPASQEILLHMAKEYEKEILTQTLLYTIALSSNENAKEIKTLLLSNIALLDDDEYHKLAAQLQSSRLDMKDNLLLNTIKNSSGHLYFDSSINDKENTQFNKAKKLFHTKGDLKKIEEFLSVSMDISPAYSQNLEYLASVYLNTDRTIEASLIYKTLCILNAQNIEAIARMSDLMKQLGYPKLSENYHNYLNILTYEKNLKNGYVNKILNKEKK